MGLLALCLAVYPASHLASAALDYPVALTLAQAVVRHGLVAGIGLLVRPIPIKVAVVGLSLLFLLVDVLTTTGLFNLYAAMRPEPGPFIYFEF
jgi:hypothetical protein